MMLLGSVRLPNVAITSLAIDSGWAHPEHGLIGGKPRRQYLGREGDGVQLTCRFDVDLGHDPIARRDELMALADEGEALALQSMSGYLFGYFVIEHIRSTPTWTLADGTVLSMLVELQLGDAVEGPAAAPAADGLEGAPVQTTDTGPAEDATRDPDEVPPSEIARL